MSKNALSTAAMEICETAFATPPAKDTVPAAKRKTPSPRPPMSSCGIRAFSSPTSRSHALSFSPSARSA